tara:strand:- start:428 stop:1333 length:906 start_codon:yes stop_codon:yes gene_type:complete
MKKYYIYFFKYLRSKLSAKIWQSYVLSDEQFKEFSISKKLSFDNLIKIPIPRNHLISADPSFINSDCIIFESIKISNGCGQIYFFNINTGKLKKFFLKRNKHYSFPQYYEIKKCKYITFESNEDYGLIIYKIKSNILDNEQINLEKIKIQNNPRIKFIDPIIIYVKDNYYCFASDKVKPNLTKCIGRIHFKEEDKIEIDTKKIIDYVLPHRLAGKSQVSKKGIIFHGQISNYRYGEGVKKFISKNNRSLEAIETYKINDKKYFGPHTLNFSPCNKYVALDICYESFNLIHLFVKIMQFLKR